METASSDSRERSQSEMEGSGMSEEESESGEGRDEKQNKEDAVSSSFLKEFIQLVMNLKSLNLLHFFGDHAVEDVIQMRVSL